MLSACRDGNLERVSGLMAHQPALATCQFNYTPPLHCAVREGHLPLVRLLIEAGAYDPHYKGYPFGDSLLTIAQDRGYDEVARVELGLTGDRAALDRALAAAALRQGTRIDLALAAAAGLLLDPARPGSNRPVLVLLSDGRQGGAAELVHAEARRLAEAGVSSYAIAFGSDADLALLAAVAGAPERALVAPDAAALAAVYRQVAGAIVCR